MEAYLLDTVLHFLLGLVLLFVVQFIWHRRLTFADDCSLKKCSQIAAVMLYFREVTQHQTKYYASDIMSGWLPWLSEHPWSWGKQAETFIPIILLLAIPWIMKAKRVMRPQQ